MAVVSNPFISLKWQISFVSQEVARRRTLMWLAPVIGPDCSKCPAPLTNSLTWCHDSIWLAAVCSGLMKAEPLWVRCRRRRNPRSPRPIRVKVKGAADTRRGSQTVSVYIDVRRVNLVRWTRAFDCFSVAQLLKRRHRRSSTFLRFGSERSAADRKPRSVRA